MAGAHADGAKTYLVVVSSLLGVVFFAIVVVLVLLLTREPADDQEILGDLEEAECVEGVRETCSPGYSCIGRECVEDPPAQCVEGDAESTGCVCLSPLKWQSGVCRPEQRQVAAEAASRKRVAAACQDPEVQAAVKELITQCGGKGLSECPPGSFDELVMSGYRFDKLMSVFPDRVSVHFPFGLPRLNSHSWPDKESTEHYVRQLTAVRGLVDKAKLVFVIGRASKSRDPKRSQAYATARINVVLRAFLPMLYGDTPEERAKLKELDRKVMLFALGESKVISFEFFSRNFSHRYTTWSDATRLKLQQVLSNAKAASTGDQQWAHNTVNQMVLIVPIPCDGTEATATAPSP
jgi:hypothetical protein